MRPPFRVYMLQRGGHVRLRRQVRPLIQRRAGLRLWCARMWSAANACVRADLINEGRQITFSLHREIGQKGPFAWPQRFHIALERPVLRQPFEAD